MLLYGGIEAGGTKFVCTVATGPDDIRGEVRFKTEVPEPTIKRAIAFFEPFKDELSAVGIGAFGPVDPDPRSSTFGFITDTPKPGWDYVDLAGAIREALGVPVAFDTDVNAAAIGEGRWGAGQDVDSFMYLTVGTGIGGGAVVNGAVVHGLMHPEMGHVSVPRPARDTFEGTCPFHGDCLEGLAAGPAIEARWGQRAETLPPDHEAWDLEAHYLATALVNYLLTLSPERIILGGGVMEQVHLFPMIRAKVEARLNRYVARLNAPGVFDRYIVPPGLGAKAGMLGAIAMAQANVTR